MLRYRVMAYVTGVVLIVLCFVGIPLQVFAHDDVVVNYVGTTHGILYIIYLATAYQLSRLLEMKLASPQTVILLLAGTIPVLTFVVERWMTRRYIDPALAASGRRRGSQCADHRAAAGPVSAARPARERALLHRAAGRAPSPRPGARRAARRAPGAGDRLRDVLAGRLDAGTRLLLETAPPPPAAGDLLDLGCGYGPLALVLAARSPGATVWAVDVNERALAALRGQRAAGRPAERPLRHARMTRAARPSSG